MATVMLNPNDASFLSKLCAWSGREDGALRFLWQVINSRPVTDDDRPASWRVPSAPMEGRFYEVEIETRQCDCLEGTLQPVRSVETKCPSRRVAKTLTLTETLQRLLSEVGRDGRTHAEAVVQATIDSARGGNLEAARGILERAGVVGES